MSWGYVLLYTLILLIVVTILGITVWMIMDSVRITQLVRECTVFYDGQVPNAQCFVYNIYSSALHPAAKDNFPSWIRILTDVGISRKTLETIPCLTPDDIVIVLSIYKGCA